MCKERPNNTHVRAGTCPKHSPAYEGEPPLEAFGGVPGTQPVQRFGYFIGPYKSATETQFSDPGRKKGDPFGTVFSGAATKNKENSLVPLNNCGK